MKKPIVTLKAVKHVPSMSRETECFTANVYIDNVKVAEAENQGHGGNTDYRSIDKKFNVVIANAEKYFKSLPEVKIEGYNFTLQPTLENVIDDLMSDWLQAKEDKKFIAKMKKKILIGSPNPNRTSYSEYSFKVALSIIPKDQLQASVDRISAKLTDGEIILNTNLKALGIIY